MLLCFEILIFLGIFVNSVFIFFNIGWNWGCKKVEFVEKELFLWIWMVNCWFNDFIFIELFRICFLSCWVIFFISLVICDWLVFCLVDEDDFVVVCWDCLLCCLLCCFCFLLVEFLLLVWNFSICWVILLVCCWMDLIGVGLGLLGWNFIVIILVFFGIFFILILFCILKVNFIEFVICLNFSMFIFENESSSIKKYISNDIKFVKVFI